MGYHRDFNEILSRAEKRGEACYPEWILQGFKNVISQCGLVKLISKGYKFIWSHRFGNGQYVEENLDRGLRPSLGFRNS